MKRLYKIVRAVVVTLLLLGIGVPALMYVLLALPPVQSLIKSKVESVLSDKLDAEVTIRDLGISPFNRAVMRDVAVVHEGDTLLTVARMGAGINIYELLAHRRVAVNYVEVRSMNLRLWRDSLTAPLNIQPIVDALKQDKKDDRQTTFDFRINTVMVRGSAISYDVLSEPLTPGRFNPHHIAVSNWRTDISLPAVSDTLIEAQVRRFDFSEQSGLELSDLTLSLRLTTDRASVTNLKVAMPRTQLTFDDIELKGFNGWNDIGTAVMSQGLDVGIGGDSHIYLPDLSPLEPALADVDRSVRINVKAAGDTSAIRMDNLDIRLDRGEFDLSVPKATVSHPLSVTRAQIDVPAFTAKIKRGLAALIPDDIMRNRQLPNSATLEGNARLSHGNGRMAVNSRIDNGRLDLTADYRRSGGRLTADIAASARRLQLGALTGISDLGPFDAKVESEVTLIGGQYKVDAAIRANDVVWKQHSYDNLTANLTLDNATADGNIQLYDEAMALTADGVVKRNGDAVTISLQSRLSGFDPYALNLAGDAAYTDICADFAADMVIDKNHRADGTISISDIGVTNSRGNRLEVASILVQSEMSDEPQKISVNSDFLNGQAEGTFDFASLPVQFMCYARELFPAVVGNNGQCPAPGYNDFEFSFVLSETERYRDFLALPVSVLYPVHIDGHCNSSASDYAIKVDAPYLRQKDKLIEETTLSLSTAGSEPQLRAHSRFPVKQGMLTVDFEALGAQDSIDTTLQWKIARDAQFDGELSAGASLRRLPGDSIFIAADIRPSVFTFNDTAWTIAPAKITYSDRLIDVDGFALARPGQHVKVNGVASASASDMLYADILNMDLDYIFQTIGIDAVRLGGVATGQVEASALLSSAPHINTGGIDVKDISYNGTVFGDAVVLSHWNQDDGSVTIDGTITQPNGGVSKVLGHIYALRDSLDMHFVGDRIPCGFLGLYMQAFATDVTGEGTGEAHLYGTFKDIDLTGRLFADNLSLRLKANNVVYHATDSIILQPGRLSLNNVKITDNYGHSARLSGALRHDYFRDAVIDFRITDAKGLMVFDQTAADNPDWYGRVFADGKATIKGVPGRTDVDMDVSTAGASTFSFVLSDLEVADEYTFLTFRDKTAANHQVVEEEEIEMEMVNRMRRLIESSGAQAASEYNITMSIDINPDTEINLVMDPVTGDRIRSHGSGDVRLDYTSADNGLRMFGRYVLDRGTYNFTLQDIIIKEFTIREGSSITFTGDPDDARLDINAVYTVNANLSDLDESFLQDKDLNRTNVPVYAVLKVSGSIEQPEIAFDIEFPTLTSDVDRKVRSIISTDEMLNRQIIYLLALNRFYTPDYMSSTTKGNELVSVASSTLSSQLSNMLGQLSDKWAIAPSLRSDKGDFSDVEVDVMLSSRLLNNRLLLNGNFGYRDKSLNDNQFIGDFDLEYLLNKTGSIRLKAYNRYNDQNYYLRSAATTQGVGVVFKRDFDNIFSFIRPWWRKNQEETTQSVDSEDQ